MRGGAPRPIYHAIYLFLRGPMPDLWPADKVERRPIAELIPAARNARTHSEEQVVQIAASIKEWGWTVPVLIDEGGSLIAGHGRVLAARKLGLVDVPVMIATGWSDAKKRAYLIADNKLTLNGEWDLAALKIELAELREADFDIDLTGFSLDELDDLFNEEANEPAGNGSLADQFMIAPFSVLNAREGWWQNRKRLWIGLGIQSELGRGEGTGDKLTMSETVQRLKPSADQALKRSK